MRRGNTGGKGGRADRGAWEGGRWGASFHSGDGLLSFQTTKVKTTSVTGMNLLCFGWRDGSFTTRCILLLTRRITCAFQGPHACELGLKLGCVRKGARSLITVRGNTNNRGSCKNNYVQRISQERGPRESSIKQSEDDSKMILETSALRDLAHRLSDTKIAQDVFCSAE